MVVLISVEELNDLEVRGKGLMGTKKVRRSVVNFGVMPHPIFELRGDSSGRNLGGGRGGVGGTSKC